MRKFGAALYVLAVLVALAWVGALFADLATGWHLPHDSGEGRTAGLWFFGTIFTLVVIGVLCAAGGNIRENAKKVSVTK